MVDTLTIPDYLYDLAEDYNNDPTDPAVRELLMAHGCMVVTMDIENTYERYGTVWTKVTLLVPPEPDPEKDPDGHDDWTQRFINDQTGTGRTGGDSWYDITWTECSNPAHVGRTFDWGY